MQKHITISAVTAAIATALALSLAGAAHASDLDFAHPELQNMQLGSQQAGQTKANKNAQTVIADSNALLRTPRMRRASVSPEEPLAISTEDSGATSLARRWFAPRPGR